MSNGKQVLVIGAGIVGLSAAYAALKDGARVTVVDQDPEGDKASYGNAGGIAVTEVIPASVPGLWKKVPFWMMDPLGPLSVRMAYAPRLLPWMLHFARVGTASEVRRIGNALAAINSRVYDDLVPMFDEVGLAGDLHRRGALTVYEMENGLANERHDWDLKRSHGIEVQELTAAEVRDMEPALGPIVRSGVFTPQWSHIDDPKRVVDLLRAWLVAQGASLVAGRVEQLLASTSGPEIALAGGKRLRADKVVLSAGAWSAKLARQLGDRISMESERGYNTTLPSSGITLEREVIFADRKFVATPLAIGLRIGGAAEFGGLDAQANYARSKALLKLAKLYLPGIREEGGIEWSGHRPTTPDSLPVIGRSSASRDIIYAFGHGHLGLTQGPTTGRLVSDLVFDRTPPIDLEPFSAARFNPKQRKLA